MKLLKNSGLPLYLNEKNNLMALEAPLQYNGYGEKLLKQMEGLFLDTSKNDENENIYDVYRKIHQPNHLDLFDSHQISYDITIVKEGLIGNERKKTSGHYHSYNELRTNTYPEVYEVIKGKAMYVLQRADNFEDKNYEDLYTSDLMVAIVEEGQTIIIPPNYGHCSINAGSGPLIFSNLAYTPCKVDYDPVKYYGGMGALVIEEEGNLKIIKNDNYTALPDIKVVKVKENPNLGIEFNKSAYLSFIETPEKFDFLGNVDPYKDEIMSMLYEVEEL